MNRKLSHKEKIEFYNFLCSFVTDNRKQRFEDVACKRTRFITVVLEDIFQSHNASAVLRTCDCFGIQDVHIIENKNEYAVNPDVALGSSNWLTLHQYYKKNNNTEDCIKKLKKQGYSIIASTPHKNDCLIEELDISRKTAIMFGTEKDGLSDISIKHADSFVKIPMVGFTESFNISVSAAIALFSLTGRLRKSEVHWQLSEKELIDIKIEWVKNTVKKSELLVKQYFQKLSKK